MMLSFIKINKELNKKLKVDFLINYDYTNQIQIIDYKIHVMIINIV